MYTIIFYFKLYVNNMKLEIFIITFLFNIVINQEKTCNTNILTSLGFNSRLTPNRINVVCP